jgi:hypothetical protein
MLAAPKLPAQERDVLVSQAQAGLQILRTEAGAEPFNALLSREAALGAHLLARALAPVDAAAACRLAGEAALALDALARDQRLPATVQGRRQDAARRAGCKP